VQNCPHCTVSINEDYNFCVSCEQQVKCLKCGSHLLKGKSKCLNCGIPIDSPQSNAASINRFSLEEEQSDENYSRKISLSFTDTAIDKVASVLNGYVPLTTSVNPKRTLIYEQKPALLPFNQQVVVEEDLHTEIIQEENDVASFQSTTQNDVVENYFDKDGKGFLVSKHPDYKGKNKKIQQQRFSLLYVWAYDLFFQQPVPKENLNQAAKDNGIYDQNYTTYLGEVASRSFIKVDGTFKLNPGGHVEVQKILAEMQDSDLKGIEYWNSSRKTSSRGTRTTKEDSQKIEDWIKIASKFDCDSFDIRKLKTNAEYALLAVYDITKEIKTQESVKPGLAYEYLVQRYKTVSVTREKFRKALTNTKSYGKYFSHTSDSSYYLTQEAERLVEGWINQENTQNM
jgi:hypothetical protein